jgi:hypothetical protein
LAFLLLRIANPPDAWTLGMVAGLVVRVAFLLLGVAALLLGIAALLGGVALLYRPELPQRLVAWLTKRNDLPLTADGDDRD